ncbi:tetratricopeptide repeat protein [Streptomyces monashensis]|uniref:Regulator n=1 Tax=Streptomyces monashensis TaxID=1678012 RepID=A0A1S2QJ87_9ACTN|nr:tetratricopeptide repeat protein [Streptomyces monashensis]OIK05526.1 regulator [Streptomyces monashensis]
MGGIGKTALAVEAAHRARTEGWFPGGTLFVDLRGYDDDPVTADQAVLALLDALGVRDRDLPPTAGRQYDTYRALLAERRDRMLLILDNASDPSQYLPLLPGTDRHRVLITSRDRPDSLPVRLIDLETLAPDDSVALLTHALLDTDERDERARCEPDALHKLADLCGHLPLALQIAAGMLRRRRHRDIASLVAKIRDTGDAIAVLDQGSPGTDLYGRSLVLRPVLETSYGRLPSGQARLLRLMCLAPDAETGTETIAALAGLGPGTALSLLEDLAAAYLVTPVRPVGGAASAVRWRVHDLVRGFGAGVVAADAALREEADAARERVLEFYVRWAEAADSRLRWLPGQEEPERFGDRRQALAWLDGERAGLAAAAAWAQEGRFTDAAVRLAWSLSEYLSWRRYFDDWIAVMETPHDDARRTGNRLDVAMDLNNLGFALQEAGRAQEAIDAHTRARDLSQAVGDRHGEAIAWNYLGLALREAGRAEEAIDAHTRARDLHQTVGDRHREASAWNNLGLALQRAGRPEEAIGAYRTSLEMRRKFEDRYGEGQTLYNLAIAHEAAQRPAEARTFYFQSADAYTRADAPAKAAQARARAAKLPEEPD